MGKKVDVKRRRCRGRDPLCPCQDGLLCHYVDDPKDGTKAMPIPRGRRSPRP